MKKILIAVLFLAICLVAVGIHAQNPALTPSTLTIPAAVLHTNCAVSSGATVYCFAGDGLWISLNGAAFTQAGSGGGTAGVTSFNGRTGAVVSAANDYSYAQLSAHPTAINCGATGCTIQ